MVVARVDKTDEFVKTLQKIRDEAVKEKVKKQILKILENPETGKPMQYSRKGTREVYVSPFRLSYTYIPEENKVILLELYHKDEQ